MTKRQTCLMIDGKIVEQCKRQGINMSEVAQVALQSVLAGTHFKDEELYLAHLIKGKSGLEDKANLMESKLNALKKRIKVYGTKIGEQTSIVEKVRKSKIVATLMQELNSIVGSYSCDIEKSWAETEEIRELLDHHGRGFTKESFINHIEFLKQM